jgi:hypothetical protein
VRTSGVRVFILLLTACGSDPPPVAIDAPPSDAANLCLVEADYGDAGTTTGTTSLGPTTSTIVLDPGPPRDSFFLKLTTGKGVFSGGLQTGTFTIAGDELDSTTCGLCVNLLADIGSMGPQKFFFADGGTVTLTSHTPPAGTISNVTMHEVTSGGAAVIGGCTTAIDAMTFSTQ